MKSKICLYIILLFPGIVCSAPEPVVVNDQRCLIMDERLIAETRGDVEVEFHKPVEREIVFNADEPWEGNLCNYFTVFRDKDKFRMYYRGANLDLEKMKHTHPIFTCYAESRDGIHWNKPDLGIVEFDDSKNNNIVREGKGTRNFVPFKDHNPDCKPEAQYKAVGRDGKQLFAFQSPDGFQWSLMQEEPIITQGDFDSQNVAFRDRNHNEYRIYFRKSRNGYRDIMMSRSKDFRQWTEPQWLEISGTEKTHLYTNQVMPYYRAPHIYIGFPSRYIDRGWVSCTEKLSGLEHRKFRRKASERYGSAVTESLFMFGNNGISFRCFPEAFIRPGPENRERWVYADNFQIWGIVPPAENEFDMSFFATEGSWRNESVSLRRYTLRADGFISLSASMNGGVAVTPPLVFSGNHLSLNCSTSAAGSIRVEIRDAGGKPIEGYTLSECPEIFGDSLKKTVEWEKQKDLSDLAGKPVRILFELKDADLYSFRFGK